jgi:sialate O-acetylesterase
MSWTTRTAFALIAVLALGASFTLAAELRLARHFGDGMVLQRDKPVTVRGFADPGASVALSFAGQSKSAKADADGQWSVTLDAMAANANSQALTVKAGGETVTLKDVVVGDVLLVARQTTIDISLQISEAGRKAAAGHRENPSFRAICIKTIPAAKPQNDLDAKATTGWAIVDKDAAMKMTAAAYHLGRELATSMDVPVGIVDLNMGGAFPVGWLSREALEETEKFYGGSDVPGQIKRFDAAVEALAKGEPLNNKDCLTPDFVVEHPMFPAGAFNGALHPLRHLALKAAMVQLGNDYPYMIYAALEDNGTQFDRVELNRVYVQTYDLRKNGFRMEPKTLPRMPRIWRETLGDAKLPMGLIVPPASDLNTLGQHHREMRELQRLMAEDNPNVGVILPGSEYVRYSAQPADEELLAQRCLHWVRGAVYGDGTPATGPLFDRIEANFNEATVHFKPGTAKGLKARGDALDYFEAASVEGDYSPVKARLLGESIHVVSDTVNRITRVRYNWNKHPNQELVNAAGLPAIPFRSQAEDYHWFVTNADNDLPIEYETPANEWQKNDVTLINGQLKTHGYGNFTGWLGPVGVKTGPFGPNMGVREVKPGSPAEGKLFEGDVIYSANGKMLGDKAWEVMAAAITHSETIAGKGKLMLGVRRGAKNLDVEITLEVMGSYSPTAPYDCPKTEKIISNLEQWLVGHGAGEGFLNTDAIFMLATGNPELQGHVRRIIYAQMAKNNVNKPIDPRNAGKSWHNSADAFLLGEYYLATGDRNVLPHLKNYCDRLAATQNPLGGWRHNFPGGATYGLIPNAGLPGVMGMYFAKQAGLDINEESYLLGVKHFGEKRAETGFLIYGFGGCERPIPAPIDPAAIAGGKLESYNGGLSAAGILMRFAGKHRAAHLCSFISAYAWNNTFGGHGGNFWNNFWTPLGAHAHSREAFIHFWRNHRWYRECNRMFDGSLIQNEGGGASAGCGVALVAPRQRIQIVGAPTSPFSVDAPDMIKPAREAYWKKDYAGCEKLVDALLASGEVGKDDLPTVEYLGRAAREIRQSIDADIARVNKLLAAGNVNAARAEMPQLKAVMPDGDARFDALAKAVASAKPAPPVMNETKETEAAEAERQWTCLVTERAPAKQKNPVLGKVAEDQATVWRIQVVENMSQAPNGWAEPRFDDSGWGQTTLPISWRMYHTALLRAKFNVQDKKAFDLLRFRGWFFRQQAMEIYLNGELIGKVNNLEKKTGNVDGEFKASALKHLKNGENTLAITTRHNWRWGMLFMRVYNDGYGFMLDARHSD